MQPPTPDEEELAQNILQLPNRNWVQEQIQLHLANQAGAASLDGIVKSRKAL
jgi:hypothetical protein